MAFPYPLYRKSEKNTMVNVLVFPCGSEIGLEIHRSLAGSKHFKLFGASSVEDHGRFVYENYFGGLPDVSEGEVFWEKLFELQRKIGAKFIIPAHDAVLRAIIADNITHPFILVPEQYTLRCCMDKRMTYAALPSISPNESTAYPKFAKPYNGNGSKGCRIIHNEEEEAAAIRDGLIVQEYLPGPEYTVDCFTDKDGDLLFQEGRIRDRIKDGIAVETTAVTGSVMWNIWDFAEKINETLPMKGAWFFQVKERADGTLALLEVAPRIAGSSGLWRAYGVNLTELTLWDALGHNVEILFNGTPVAMSRALDNRYKLDYQIKRVYVDKDDTLFSGFEANPAVFEFLIRCRNKGIAIEVLSRTMSEDIPYWLYFLKAKIFLIPEGEPKSAYINPDGAIFIDDSFKERKEVHDALRIPVFSPNCLPCL